MVEYKEVWDPDYVVRGWTCVLEDIIPPWKCMTGEGVKGDGMKTQCYYYYEEVVQYIVVWPERQKFTLIYFSKHTASALYAKTETVPGEGWPLVPCETIFWNCEVNLSGQHMSS